MLTPEDIQHCVDYCHGCLLQGDPNREARLALVDIAPVHAYCLDSCTIGQVGYFHRKYKEEVEAGLPVAFDILMEAGLSDFAKAFLPLNYVISYETF